MSPSVTAYMYMYVRCDIQIIRKHRSILCYIFQSEHLWHIIIQQIVTLSKYGHDALDICHPQVTDILRYT